MDEYCVVVRGLQAGASGDASAWQPVAAALKLDHAEFERRVVAALPRILRNHLDQATAARIAQLMQAMHVNASVLPDDPQMAYIDRAGAICGPLPHSSLADFIQPGESYRLQGDTAWQIWQEASTTTKFEFDDFDNAMRSPVSVDEPANAIPAGDSAGVLGDMTPDTLVVDIDAEPSSAISTPPDSHDADDFGTTASAALSTSADDEAHDSFPPPPVSSSTQHEPVPEPTGDPEAITPTMDAAPSAHDDDLNDPSEDVSTPSDQDIFAPLNTEFVAPKRSPVGRIVILLVLVVLAIWAYRHWTADTRTGGSPATPAVIQPPAPTDGQPAATGRVIRSNDAMSTPASTAPAEANSAALPASATTTPATAASAPAPATTGAAAPAESPGTLPVIAGKIMPAPSAPAATSSAAKPATPTH